MCFSAEASFVGAAALTAASVLTLKKVTKPSLILFASIPLLFGLQQCTEGIVWITLREPGYHAVSQVATMVFLIFAELVWPIMVPLAVLFMEDHRKRRQLLWLLLATGTLLALYNAYCLILYSVRPEIMKQHIRYNVHFPREIRLYATWTYIAVTTLPFFVSSIKRTKILGILVILSLAVTYIFYRQYLISVWCFFAALMSGVIYWILRDAKIESERVKELNEKVTG